MTTDVNPDATRFRRVCSILDDHGHNAAKLIPILQAVQSEYRYLPAEILTFVATSLDLPPARVFGVATFYAHFSLKPKGKHIVRVCNGTACHVKGSGHVVEALRRHLQLSENHETTPDLRFTVETVSCLGACGLAPVMVVDGKIYGQVNAEQAIAVVKALELEACGE